MPLTYLKDKKKYATMLAAQRNMGGFMKGILVKRLESSFYAFRKTLQRFIESYERFIEMYKSGDVYISKKVNVYDLLDDGHTEKLLKLIEEQDVMHFKSKEFSPQFIVDLRQDLAQLRAWQDMWAMITDDPKLTEFRRQLQTNKLIRGHKVIVFTESMETAQYLYDNLQDIYGERIVCFSGQSSAMLKIAIEDSFNPKNKAKDNDRYDLLITTDILAEGINLHRAKGAFYTPREIVHYMCQESLIAYLARTTGVSEGAIRDFILYGDFMKDEDTVKAKSEGNGGMYISDELFLIDGNGQIVVDRLKDIDKALATIRVADPAVGSGAFPLGMLNEIVRARQNITAYMAIPMNSYADFTPVLSISQP